MTGTHTSPASRLVPLLLLCAACGGGEAAKQQAAADSAAKAASACRVVDDSIITGAAATFAKSAKPVPVQFLRPMGVDSALPEVAIDGLMPIGQVRTFPADPAQQKQAISASGRTATLVIYYHGLEKRPDGRVATKFSGHYVGVTAKDIPTTTVLFKCNAPAEELYTIEGAGGAAAAAPAGGTTKSP